MLSNAYFVFLQNFVLIQPRTSPPKIRKNLQNFGDAGHRLPGDAGEELEPAAGSARAPAPRGEEELREERREGIAWLKRLFDV